MSSEYKTTPKHFALFKKHVELWLDHFGLKDWETIISHETPGDCKDGTVMGACLADLASRGAYIHLCLEWNQKITDELIKGTAFHETCELLLSELDILAKTREIHPYQLDSARHAIIARLYNSIAAEKYR